MSDPTPLEALVEQLLSGRAPRPLRVAASRGALPLPRPVLVRLYVALLGDSEPDVRDQASASLQGLERSAVGEVLVDPSCAPEVLEFFAARATRDEVLAERIAFHRAVPDGALAKLAAEGSGKVIDLVLTNQQRLLSQTGLLDRLSTNPALRPDQRGRILELLERASKLRPSGAAPAGQPESGKMSPELEEVARLLEIDVGELFAASEIIDGEEFEQSEDPQVRSAYARILTLNTAQKAILAMRGGREERMILVRDSNQIVAMAVLRNGRITDDDIETMVRMRNVSGEVLRQIAQNRDWLRSYVVVASLVRNPRTPPGVSTNLVSRLHSPDLKAMSGNHDVPELIRRMARRTLELRAQQTGKSFKKH